jgi:hypothetical protein
VVTEGASTEYERQLSDTEVVALAVLCDQRIAALLNQGVAMPMQEIENHHIIGLLEQFIGPHESIRVREWHLTWLDRMLDKAEATARAHVLGALDLLNDNHERPDLPFGGKK